MSENEYKPLSEDELDLVLKHWAKLLPDQVHPSWAIRAVKELRTLRAQLAEATERAEKAERERDDALIDASDSESAYISRCDLSPHPHTQERDDMVAWCDLMCDEFQRIVSLLRNNANVGIEETLSKEIIGLCNRAISRTTQHVPVIAQRDQLRSELFAVTAENARLQAQLADDDKNFVG